MTNLHADTLWPAQHNNRKTNRHADDNNSNTGQNNEALSENGQSTLTHAKSNWDWALNQALDLLTQTDDACPAVHS